MTDRWDETFHRLQQWTSGQAQSERLAAQILYASGFEDVDPSHPLGGKDGGRDAEAIKDGNHWIMAVYFPRGQQSFPEIKRKFAADLKSAREHEPFGVAFVTNQEIRRAERTELQKLGNGIEISIFHVEKVVGLLDRPTMAQVRQQFLAIGADQPPILLDVEVVGSAYRFTGGEELRASWIETEKESEDKKRSGPVQDVNPAYIPAWMAAGHGSAMQLSGDDHDRRVARWESEFVRDWENSEEHLAATALQALQFRIRNRSQAFLKKVEVILTFKNARAVEFLGVDYFSFEKVLTSVYPKIDIGYMGYDPAMLANVRRPDYPVSFTSRGDDVRVVIELEHLRPFPEWESDADDLVLLAGSSEQAEVLVQWTATADGYGEHVEGDHAPLSVKLIDAYVALEEVEKKSRGID
ncbi:hypothetical protein [Nocardia mangyaensis]|uniref:hypothetical protein n=1 Tax=Nocardia mangyaensis TaxID=2213200 RepID=UPI0026765229|nr:hypothetical protein [Nocardia mangyaensis]MDO3650750.1 hypothetical protein [Nocardia mangyaensis]